MTDRFDEMIVDLAGGVLEAADAAPVSIRQVSAQLPMAFGLRFGAGGAVVVAQPPEDTQARDLATPVGRFAFTLALEGGGHNG